MKKKVSEPIDEEWMATYSDMVTLLLCFFVLMLAASTPDASKYEQIKAGLTEGIGKRESQRPIETMLVELREDVQTMNVTDDVALGNDSQGIVIEFSGDVFFAPGSAKIKEELLPTLKRIAATLQSERYHNFFFSVEGHTSDEKPQNSIYANNWELSAARAAAVVEFLESRGIDRVRLKATGMYDIAPKYPNRDAFGDPIPQNRRKNRRVVIHAEPKFF